jgi:hypothetical protein
MRVLLDRRPLLDVSVRRTNPAIPHALEAIVAKCLAVSPDDRYPDAGALAEDLGRFIEHRPLVHAVNPSRPERTTNWAFRHRLRLAVGAVFLSSAVFLLVGLAVGRSMYGVRPSGPIESSPILKSAVDAFEGAQLEKSIEQLGWLKGLYPDSPLPLLYLSLAFDAGGHEMDADRSFGELLRMSNHAKPLVAWGVQHRRLAQEIDLYVRLRHLKASDISKKPYHTEEARQRQRDEQYRLAEGAAKILSAIQAEMPPQPVAEEQPPLVREASDILSKDRPASEVTEYNLALSEQELQRYDSVISRAGRAIESALSRKPTDTTAAVELEENLFKWRRLRSRAFTKRAERFRIEGTNAAREKALKDLEAAFEDLKRCNLFATMYNRSLDLHSVERVRAEALMTRVELDIDLGRLERAKVHMKNAREGLRRYNDLALLVDRKYELGPFYKRLAAIDARLRREEANKSGGDAAPPAE